MNDIICKKTNRMEVKTFSALQNVRYFLKSKEKHQEKKQSKKLSTSLDLFHRDDIKKDPVDSKVSRHMQMAHGRYRKSLAQKKEKSKEKTSMKRAAALASEAEHPKKKKRKGKEKSLH